MVPEIVISLLVLINIVTFIVYGADKRKAREHRWRIPERVLILLAAVGGSIGALAGMCVFHHKTRHPKFFFGVPVILVLQIILVLLILRFF